MALKWTAAVVALVALSLGAALALSSPPMTCDTWTDAKDCTKLPGGITQLTLNEYGGGAMQTPVHFITGQFSIDLKFMPGNSGGTAVAYYIMDSITPTNKDPRHSEIDMEFYGNTTAKTVMLATNLFNGGKQNLAQFRLPFDPSLAFHNYAIRWNARQVVWLVDGIPLRIVNRAAGQPWPTLSMNPQLSIWATPWSALKVDYTTGPKKVWMKNFLALGCPAIPTAAQARAIQCAGPWNLPLTAAQMAGFARLNKVSLLVDYGWDKA